MYPKLFLVAYVVATGAWLMMSHGLIDRSGQPLGADFVNVWAASASALKGEPAAAYDIGRHHAEEKAALGRNDVPFYGWHYPPMFLLIVLPLALLPYLWALVIWMSLTLGGYLVVLRRVAPGRQALWLAIAFPGALINFANGQNGFLTVALFGGGLILLEQSPIAAGALFGLMIYKPQFGALIPLALLADRRWRALSAACLASAVFATASLAIFGEATWRAFLDSIAFTRGMVLEQGAFGFYKLQSVFGAVRLWGGSIHAAYAAQVLIAIYAAVAVVWVWRAKSSFALKAAVLSAGSLLVSPYVLDYDLVLLALPIAWFAMEGCEHRFLPFEKSGLVAAWILPFISRIVAAATMVPIGPMLNIGLLALILRRVAHGEPTPTVDVGSAQS